MEPHHNRTYKLKRAAGCLLLCENEADAKLITAAMQAQRDSFDAKLARVDASLKEFLTSSEELPVKSEAIGYVKSKKKLEQMWARILVESKLSKAGRQKFAEAFKIGIVKTYLSAYCKDRDSYSDRLYRYLGEERELCDRWTDKAMDMYGHKEALRVIWQQVEEVLKQRRDPRDSPSGGEALSHADILHKCEFLHYFYASVRVSPFKFADNLNNDRALIARIWRRTVDRLKAGGFEDIFGPFEHYFGAKIDDFTPRFSPALVPGIYEKILGHLPENAKENNYFYLFGHEPISVHASFKVHFNQAMELCIFKGKADSDDDTMPNVAIRETSEETHIPERVLEEAFNCFQYNENGNVWRKTSSGMPEQTNLLSLLSKNGNILTYAIYPVLLSMKTNGSLKAWIEEVKQKNEAFRHTAEQIEKERMSMQSS